MPSRKVADVNAAHNEIFVYDRGEWEYIAGQDALDGYRVSSNPEFNQRLWSQMQLSRTSPLRQPTASAQQSQSTCSMSEVSDSIELGLRYLRQHASTVKELSNMFKCMGDCFPILAGGSVLNLISCFTLNKPSPQCDLITIGHLDVLEDVPSKLTLRNRWESSDIDVFIVGPRDQENEKLNLVDEVMRADDLFYLRSDFAVTMKGESLWASDLIEYCGSLQIVLAQADSIKEVLASFDIDCCCFAFDGARLWSNRRGIVSLYHRTNYYREDKRTHAYEARVTKYMKRGFDLMIQSHYGVTHSRIATHQAQLGYQEAGGLLKFLNGYDELRVDYDSTIYGVSIEQMLDGAMVFGEGENVYEVAAALMKKSMARLETPRIIISDRYEGDITRGVNMDYVRQFEHAISNAIIKRSCERIGKLLIEGESGQEEADALITNARKLTDYMNSDDRFGMLKLGPIRFQHTVEDMKIMGQERMTPLQRENWLCLRF